MCTFNNNLAELHAELVTNNCINTDLSKQCVTMTHQRWANTKQTKRELPRGTWIMSPIK